VKKNLVTIIISSILILLGYLVITHPFEIPDEQSHYASVHYLVIEGRMPTMQDPRNLSQEEHLVEQVFGIMSEGENKYSYHPEFRMEYIDGYIGKFEGEISSYNTAENRESYTVHQAALYPPLYYWFASLFYRTSHSADIILRLFVTRFSSLFLTSLIPLVAYLIGRRIWQREQRARILALMTLFFPMTTYLGVGVNSDNLHNLLFGVSTLLLLNLIKNGWSKVGSLLIGTVFGLDLITKPQAYILLPILAIAVLTRWRWGEWREWLSNLPYLIVPILLIAGWQEIPKFMVSGSGVGMAKYVSQSKEFSSPSDFRIFTSGYLNTHLREMPVWYWGVFKWFGVIMPRPFWFLANRLVGLSVVGLIIQFVRDVRAKKLSWHTQVIIFGILANLIYAAALFWFDWQFYQEYGRSLGLQARYYMPLLITQMGLLYMGLLNLAWNKSIEKWISRGLVIFFLTLQLGSLYTQLMSYYDLNSFPIFLQQISQYKPFFAKAGWWYLWIPTYFAGIISLTSFALKKNKK